MTATGPAPASPDLAARLAAACAPCPVVQDAVDRAPYERDWRGRTAAPALAVALPRSTAEVQQVVRACIALDLAIVPQGGNTGLCGGSVPLPGLTRPQVIVSLRGLRAVRAVDPANDTLTVEAGVTLQAVQELAAQHDRLFPLSLAAEGSCTIGGNLATNAGGVQVLRYGTARALCLGLEVVLPDGALWQDLRGLRKNNTGLDLKQCFIGAEGTLGLITAATLRLFPRPRDQQVAWIGLPSPEAALALLHALRARLGECLSSYELIGALPLALVLRHLPSRQAPFPGATACPWHVLVQADDVSFDQLASCLADSLAQPDCAPWAPGASAARGTAADPAAVVLAGSAAQAQALWQLREDLSEAQRHEGPSLKHDIALPVAGVAAFIREAAAALGALQPGARVVCFGHLGDGNLHYNLFPADAHADPATLAQAHAALTRCVHDLVAQHGGSFSAEHGVGQFKVGELARYQAPQALQLMQALKAAWDPDQRMNPGKLFACPPGS